MDRFQELRCLVAVVDAGSFVAAAAQLGLSKAAVSRQLGELEQRLGVRLLQRTTRRLSLTDEGQRFQLRARELLAGLDEAEAELSSQAAAPSGSVRVTAPLTFGVLQLGPLWGRFAARFPQVRLDITLADQVVDLVDEGYDLAVRISRLPSSTLVSRRLATTRVVLCASPQYLALHGSPTTVAELAAHRVIAYRYSTGGDDWQFAGPTGAVSVKTRPILQTNNGDTCRLAALDHQGIILQPDFLVGADLQRGDLVELLPAYRSLELGIYAVYPSRKHLPQKVRVLVDFLVEAFRQPSWQA